MLDVTVGVTLSAIRSFAHKGLEQFSFHGSKKGIQPKHARKLADILDRLDAAGAVKDMGYSGSNLHSLKGELSDYWAVKVSRTWRVIFRFVDGDAFNIGYIDYH